jgi:hypothetical protein
LPDIKDNFDMNPQYAYQSAPANFMPMMAGGGLAAAAQQKYGLASAAEELRKRGRYGDTILAHINPQEAGILQLLGGSGTINPHTGLPEFFLKSVFKGISNIGKSIGNVLKPVAKIAPFILPFIPGIGLPMQALLSGGIGGLSGGKGFDLKRALLSGLSTYGIGSLMNAASAANASTLAGGADPFMSTRDVAAFGLDAPANTIAGGADPFMSAKDVADQVGGALSGGAGGSPFGGGGPQIVNVGTAAAAGAPVSVTPIAPSAANASNVFEFGYPTAASTGAAPIVSVEGTGLPGLTPGAAGPAPTTAQSFANLAGAAGETALTAGTDAAKYIGKQIIKNPVQSASLALTGYGAIKSKEELDNQKKEADRILKNREREKAEDVAQAQQFLRDYPLLYQRLTAEDVQRLGLASGGGINFEGDYDPTGVASLVKGGMPPRYLRGGGDGMSDSIPARIGGRQEARLADGEFVVPADVVSHIGNGSSNAGAKKLYAMMDRARQARTGRTRQAPAVNAQRYMPA